MRTLLLSLLPLLFMLGCPKPFVEVSPDWTAEPLQPAILAGAAASFDVDEEDAGIAIMDTVMNAHLPDYGDKMMERMKPFLAERGFALTTDHDRVSTAEQETLEKLEKFTSIAAGAWICPDGSMVVVNNSALFRKNSYEMIIERAAPVQPGEHFVFIDARIYKMRKWFVVGFARMVLDVIVIDHQGSEVYAARGVGDGPTSAFVALHHVEALTEAMEYALTTIEAEVPVVVTD